MSRGYQAECTNFPHQVTDTDSAVFVGDEAYMQFNRIGVPTVIDPNRSRAIDYLLCNNQVDLVISDDGLQHYKMGRKIEVVMFDGERQFGNRLILPFGPLREPVSRLKTVDFVIENGDEKNPFTNNKTIINPISFVNLLTKQELTLEEFENTSVNAVAAIGNPRRFFKTLGKLAKVNTELVYEDHHSFSASDFESLNPQEIVVMTEKDASKCYPFAKENWYFLKIEMSIEEHLLEQIKDKLQLD